MSFKDIQKRLHDALVEDDGKTPAVKPVTPVAHPPTMNYGVPTAYPMGPGAFGGAAPAPAASSPFTVPSTVVVDETIYQRVHQKTDFDQTEVGRTVHKYYDALPQTLDINTRFKAALAQAGALDNITPDRVLAACDGLKAALQGEVDKFSRIVEGQNQNEVVGRQQHLQQINDQIAKLTQQIADLQQQHTQTSADLVDAQGKIANASTQFQLAVQRRANEIDQQKAQFTALLQ